MSNEPIDTIEHDEPAADEHPVEPPVDEPTETQSKKGKLHIDSAQAAPDLTGPEADVRERAEEAAEKLLGTRAGAALLVTDMFKNLAIDSADSLIELLERVGSQVDTVTIKGTRYELVNLLTIMPDDLSKAWDLLGELWEDVSEGDSLSIVKAGRAVLTDARVDELLAILFVPEGADEETRENHAERVPLMRKLNIGQRLGALWRFFTSVAPSVADSLRTFLQRAATINLLKFARL